ncbi:membrane protein [Sphingomonas sp. Ag1]|jgi:uncharacterized membrane protein YadS|nr:membrane protein [Sphingomonas sp. Ag1]
MVASTTEPGSAWRELWMKEDWWATWIGLSIVLAACALFWSGSSLRWLAVVPPRWTDFRQVVYDIATNWPRYIGLYVLWLAAFSLALAVMGQRVRAFLPAFTLLYLAAYAIFVIGQWQEASSYNLEPPLLALLVGLVIANTVRLPSWFEAGLKTEFYVKTGIVLLGATLPLSLVVQAGPVAMLQAALVSIVTFTVIYTVAVRLGLDRRFAATLGVGGAACGVSAAIAVAGAVGGKKEDTAVVITIVVIWAMIMVFALPLAGRALGLPTGVAGAWIGTSEFADAAGFAAAQTYGGYAGEVQGITGTADQAISAFTLMKVVGRDMWVGVWAVGLAIIATTRWGPHPGGSAPDVGEIWRRFPKFVIGLFLASAIITAATAHYSLERYDNIVAPTLTGPIKDLRTWAFIFCFFSIGLTTRFRDLAAAGRTPFGAFTAGVVVNVILGFVLSVYVFGAYWATLGQ